MYESCLIVSLVSRVYRALYQVYNVQLAPFPALLQIIMLRGDCIGAAALRGEFFGEANAGGWKRAPLNRFAEAIFLSGDAAPRLLAGIAPRLHGLISNS